MTKRSPYLSKDFPRLIRTLFLAKKIDYWDFSTKVYRNAKKANTESYFKTVTWVHLDRRCPTCPDFEYDWRFIEDTYVKPVPGTKMQYRIDSKAIMNSPLKEYAIDETLVPLIPLPRTH